MLTGALAFTRAAYFIATMLLFGSTAMRVLMRTRLPHMARVRMSWLCGAALLAAAIAAVAWFVLATAQMAGDPEAALDPGMLARSLHTLFGIGFVMRLAALVLAAATLAIGSDIWNLTMFGIALALPALTGHAAASSPAHFAAIGITIDSLHLLTAGFWVGGLALLALLFARKTEKADLLLTLSLFSEWAMVAILLLLLSGLLNVTLVLLGQPGPASQLYLIVLGLKLTCVAAMLALACINRFRLMPKLDADAAAARLKRNIALELGLGIVVVALAGLLGQLAPTQG